MPKGNIKAKLKGKVQGRVAKKKSEIAVLEEIRDLLKQIAAGVTGTVNVNPPPLKTGASEDQNQGQGSAPSH